MACEVRIYLKTEFGLSRLEKLFIELWSNFLSVSNVLQVLCGEIVWMVKSDTRMTTVGCNSKVLSPAQIVPGEGDFEVRELPRIHWQQKKGNYSLLNTNVVMGYDWFICINNWSSVLIEQMNEKMMSLDKEMLMLGYVHIALDGIDI